MGADPALETVSTVYSSQASTDTVPMVTLNLNEMYTGTVAEGKARNR